MNRETFIMDTGAGFQDLEQMHDGTSIGKRKIRECCSTRDIHRKLTERTSPERLPRNISVLPVRSAFPKDFPLEHVSTNSITQDQPSHRTSQPSAETSPSELIPNRAQGAVSTSSLHPPPHVSLLLKLQREKAVRQSKLQSCMEHYQQKIDQEIVTNAQRLLAEKQRDREMILEHLKEQRRNMEQRQLERRLGKEKTDAELQEVKHKAYLHQKLEEQDTLEAEIRRETLLKRHKSHLKAPIDSNALWGHMRGLDELNTDKDELRRAKSESRRKDFKRWNAELQLMHRSKAAARIEEEIIRRKEEPGRKAESVQGFYAKKQRYGLLVRELFPPRPSKLTTSFVLETCLPSLKPPKRRFRSRAKVLHSPKPNAISQCVHSLGNLRSVPKPKDYLTDLRRLSEASFSSNPYLPHSPNPVQFWSDSKSASPEKLRKVRSELGKMDAMAHKQNSLLNRMDRRWSQQAEGREAVADLYLAAIKAKLSLLAKID